MHSRSSLATHKIRDNFFSFLGSHWTLLPFNWHTTQHDGGSLSIGKSPHWLICARSDFLWFYFFFSVFFAPSSLFFNSLIYWFLCVELSPFSAPPHESLDSRTLLQEEWSKPKNSGQAGAWLVWEVHYDIQIRSQWELRKKFQLFFLLILLYFHFTLTLSFELFFASFTPNPTVSFALTHHHCPRVTCKRSIETARGLLSRLYSKRNRRPRIMKKSWVGFSLVYILAYVWL